MRESIMRLCSTQKTGLEKIYPNISNIYSNPYCECVFDKIYNYQGNLFLDGDDYDELLDPNSVIFNETLIKCLGELTNNLDLDKNEKVVLYKKTEVDLIYFQKSHRIKVTFGKIERYLIFDSGASYILLPKNYEVELLNNGGLLASDFLREESLIQADGKLVKTKIYNLRELKIQSTIILKNVEGAFSNFEDGLLLFGKSAINKFNKWSLDNTKNKLVIE